MNNNGVIQRSKEARDKYGQAKDNEQAQMSGVSEWIDEQAGNKEGLIKLPDVTEETKPYLPKGFEKEEGTNLDNGLVIKDSIGNEYVWVEVPTSIYENESYNTEASTGDKKPTSKEETEKIEYCLKQYTSVYGQDRYADEYIQDSTKGWFAGETEYNDAKKTMLKSVYENGGFYVGRYEAGISEFRISNENEPTTVPVSKQNMFPYTNITRTQAKQLAEKVNSGECTSSLMFGIQWNLMLAFIQKKGKIETTVLTESSTNIGNYANNEWNITNNQAQYYTEENGIWKGCPYSKSGKELVLLTTGASDSFEQMHIYDVAGNVAEWTLEGDMNAKTGLMNIKLASILNKQVSPLRVAIRMNGPCVKRGGIYEYLGFEGSASSHIFDDADDTTISDGFRVSIY